MAKFLWVSYDGAGLPLALRLIEEGHEVYATILLKEMESCYDGMIEKVPLSWLMKDRERETLIVFDHVGVLKPAVRVVKICRTVGELADQLRQLGFKVFGTSVWLEKLELDRKFAKDFCQAVGIAIPSTTEFTNLDAAIAFIKAKKKRFVFKPENNVGATFVSEEPDSSDLVEYLQSLKEDKAFPANTPFVLEEFVEGTEVSCEVWYAYGRPIEGTANITLETKKSATGNVGIDVGCATSAVRAIYPNAKLLSETHKKFEIGMARWSATAPVDINVIISHKDKTPYFLEFCGGRFGYSAIFEFMELLEGELGEIFVKALNGEPVSVSLKSGWGYGVRVWVPPAPWHPDPKDVELAKGIKEDWRGTKIRLSKKATDEALKHIWWQDVKKEDGQLVMAGTDGTLCEITAYANKLQEAEKKVKEIFELIQTERGDHYARFGDGWESALKRWGQLVGMGFVGRKA